MLEHKQTPRKHSVGFLPNHPAGGSAELAHVTPARIVGCLLPGSARSGFSCYILELPLGLCVFRDTPCRP